MSKKTKKLFIQMAEYMVAGGAYFWSGYFIIVFLTPVIGLWWANIIGNGVGVTVNFILERFWVFKGSKKRHVTEVTMRYITLTGFNFLLNYLILSGLQKLGIVVAIGQFLAAAFFTVWNYLWYRFWVFKEKPQLHRIRHHA
jgi:putative flippase GtrA